MAATFAGSIVVAYLTFLLSAPQRGLLALLSLPLALFASGVLAAGSLRIAVLARVGFGVILALGGFGSFLGLVATQAMTGTESTGQLLLGFSAYFVGSYGLGAALGLPLALRLGFRVLAVGMLGFCTGGLLAAAVTTLAMATHSLTVFTATVAMPIPGAVGAATVAWSLNSVRQGR